MSFIMHSTQKTFSDFVFDENIKDAKFSNRVKRLISKYDHDIIICGYENAEGKLHYAYPNIENNSNNKLLGDDISNVGEKPCTGSCSYATEISAAVLWRSS